MAQGDSTFDCKRRVAVLEWPELSVHFVQSANASHFIIRNAFPVLPMCLAK
jgi:hypothetical protein